MTPQQRGRQFAWWRSHSLGMVLFMAAFGRKNKTLGFATLQRRVLFFVGGLVALRPS